MEAVVICRNLENKIQSGNSINGKVHSIFKNACNLVTDCDGDGDDYGGNSSNNVNGNLSGGMFITLLNNNKVMSPMSMIINTGKNFDFRNLNLKQNMSFEISNHEVLFDEVDMHITMNGAQIWNPECELATDRIERNVLEKNIKTFKNGLFLNGKFSGMETIIKDLSLEIPELNLYIPAEAGLKQQKENGLYGYNNYGFISNRFRTFIKVLIQGDVEGISENCKKIIGFGNGLTPSVDDFINGLMITNVYMGKYNGIPAEDLYAFNNSMVADSLKKTTRISSEMLKNGIYGLANDAVKRLMTLLLSSKAEEEENSDIYTDINTDKVKIKTAKDIGVEIDKAIEAAVDYGETSGTDTALGLYVGLKIWTNYDYRRVMLNDFMCRN
jgi:hypothetical protein